jgi:hypothetical protein
LSDLLPQARQFRLVRWALSHHGAIQVCSIQRCAMVRNLEKTRAARGNAERLLGL